MKLSKGPCIAYEGDKEVAWLAVDENGRNVAYNDQGFLYVISEIQGQKKEQERTDDNSQSGAS